MAYGLVSAPAPKQFWGFPVLLKFHETWWIYAVCKPRSIEEMKLKQEAMLAEMAKAAKAAA